MKAGQQHGVIVQGCGRHSNLEKKYHRVIDCFVSFVLKRFSNLNLKFLITLSFQGLLKKQPIVNIRFTALFDSAPTQFRALFG